MKNKIVRGGIGLTLRHVLSAFLSLLSTLVIARLLGPEKYGVVVTSLGIFYFLVFTGKMGLNIYIVREPNLSKEDVEQILVFYSIFGILLCAVLWLATPIFGWWSGNDQVPIALKFLIPAVWLNMVATTSQSMLERNLEFAKVSLIFALSEVANYILAISLVLIYESYLGVISGYVLQFLLFAILAYYCYPIKWSFHWNFKTLKPALKYGLTFSSSDWIQSLRSLAIPIFVSRLAGVEAVAILNISFRVAEKLLLISNVVRNMSISVIAKFLDNQESLKRLVSKGMLYQALLMGSICAGFSGFSSWIIPSLFGDEWFLSAQIFPLIGLSLVVNALFSLHQGALYASHQNGEVARFNIANVGLLWGGCLFFLPMLGVWGYGVAELISLPSHYLIHQSFCKFYKPPNYWPTFWTVLATIPPLLGGIILDPLPNVLLMLICYGSLLFFVKSVRQALFDLSKRYFA